MKRLTATALFLSIIGICVTNTPCYLSVVHGTSQKQAIEGDTDRDQAIKIAQQHAQKMNIDPARYNTTACETSLSWRVYFEPAADQGLNEVLEYIVMRKGGAVIANTVLADQNNLDRGKTSELGRAIDQADALAIVRKDLRHRDISKLQLTVCELKNFWRIIYAPRPLLDGGGPEYLLEKSTGRIADKRFFQ
jgi:hypothetical protein